jgi:hypothetical protein
LKKWLIIVFITAFVVFKELIKKNVAGELFPLNEILSTVGLTVLILFPFYLLKGKQLGYVLIISACYTIFSAYQMINLGINIAITALLIIDFVFLLLYSKLGEDRK